MLELLDELEHRRTGSNPGRDLGDSLVADAAGALHDLELLGRLRPPKLVHERRAGHDALGSERFREVEERLGPDAVAHRQRPSAPHRRRRRPERRCSVVALGDDHYLAGQLSRKVEQRHHPRQDEHRIAVGSEECSRHPSVRVLRLAEGRNGALDTREVLEVGGRGEEEEIHTTVVHAFRQTPSPLRVVEHDPSLGRATAARLLPWPR